MEAKLRELWPADDLKKRDSEKWRSNQEFSLWGEADSEDDDLGAAEVDTANMTEEGYVAWDEVCEEVEQGLAAVEHARRNLFQARQKQNEVKLNRNFFRRPGSMPVRPPPRGNFPLRK